ncbi:MAG: hypothetical protein ACOVNU_11630 [Candidatus Kapaibacteriota bacterium]
MEDNHSMDFANELFYSSDLGLFANECERFGMMSGCQEHCPVFQRGECEHQEENEKIFERYNGKTFKNLMTWNYPMQ